MEMDNSEKQTLHQEYMERIYSPIFRPLLYFGLARFHIKHGQIEHKSRASIFYTLFVVVIINIGMAYMVYALYWRDHVLLLAEAIIIVNFDIFHTCVLINICFFNSNESGLFFKKCIEMDDFLGAKETIFMRDITSVVFFIFCLVDGAFQTALHITMYFTYVVKIDGVIFAFETFMLLCCIYYDLSLFLTLYLHLILRVRYLNVALLNHARINLDYIPNQVPFNTLFWNKKLDQSVKFHERAGTEKFVKAFVMLFEKLRYLENCYRFTLFMCLSYIIVGTFVTVQAFIDCAKSYDTDKDVTRIAAIASWCLLSWNVQILLSQQAGMFTEQVNQTKLICAYIQLKPTYTDEMFELSRQIIRTLEIRDSRFSIYGIVYFDTGLLLKIGSSVFVYIITQLQFAFPKITDDFVANNASTIPINMTIN